MSVPLGMLVPVHRALIPILVAAVALAAVARADGPAPTAADVTEPGRSLDRALDLVLDPGRPVEGGKRTLVLLVDPTPSLVAAGFERRWEAALARRAARLADGQVAVSVVGTKGALALPPTSDAAALGKAVRDALATPKNGFQNVYEDLRGVAVALASRPGAREIALVTLENGDAEDDLEATVAALGKARVRTSVVAKEAFLSDSYWLSHGGKAGPKGTTLTGGDSAFVEAPWGWLFQMSIGNESAPSGFATYGLTRVAAASGGRVFLVADGGASTAHTCHVYGTCPFCSGDHVSPYGVYKPQRLKALAPLATSRKEAYAAGAKDPCFRAVLEAWRTAAGAGCLRSRPGLEVAGGTLEPDRRTSAPWAPLTANSLAFAQMTMAAEKALKGCDAAIKGLEADLARIGPEGGTPRYRAMADLTRFNLYLTRANLLGYVGFCQDAGPTIVGRKPRDPPGPPLPPETAFDPSLRFVGLSYANLSLCHGVRPYRDVRMGGGAAFRQAMEVLDGVVVEFLAKYAGTPYAVAVHRSALARFVPTVQGKPPPPPDRKLPGSTTEGGGTTPTDRPARDGGSGSTSGGATTDGR